MPKLPIVSGAAAVKALQRLGFFVDRQRGSHVVLKRGQEELSLPRKDGHRAFSGAGQKAKRTLRLAA